MKRSRLRGPVTYRTNRGRRLVPLTDEEVAAREAFHETARAQRCCRVPGCETPVAPWHAHHVCYEADLRRMGLPPFDFRNALRVCEGHHMRHHSAEDFTIPQTALTPINLAYLARILGDAAETYLARRYA